MISPTRLVNLNTIIICPGRSAPSRTKLQDIKLDLIDYDYDPVRHYLDSSFHDGQDHEMSLYDPVRHGMSYPDSDGS